MLYGYKNLLRLILTRNYRNAAHDLGRNRKGYAQFYVRNRTDSVKRYCDFYFSSVWSGKDRIKQRVAYERGSDASEVCLLIFNGLHTSSTTTRYHFSTL